MSSTPLQEIVCLLGQPVVGDPTQFMMEREFQRAGLDWRYLTLEVPPTSLTDAVRGAKALGFRGGTVAAPHCLPAAALVDRLTSAAELCGAVNCMARQDGSILGDNTIGRGFIEALRGVTDPAGKRAVLLGAGAAARAMAVELALVGVVQMTIVNRTVDKADALAALLRERFSLDVQTVAWHGDYSIPADAELLVHATSINHFDLDLRVPIKWPASTQLIVADVSFNPVDPRLLMEAKERGYVRLGGLPTFVNQSALAFQFWTGLTPDRALMRDAVEEFFG